MLGRILFTCVKGSDLDANPKRWRLIADILNDAAFFVDLLLPVFPGLFLPPACTSSLIRCVVGVAGGATPTAITQHQTLKNNLADVVAKDGSQETLVNVVALILSLVLLPLVSGKFFLIGTLFMVFTGIHLYANYQAVRSLQFQSLTRHRATFIIRSFLKDGNVPSVAECNREEPLFYSLCGTRHLDCSIRDLMDFRRKVPASKFVETEDYTLLLDERHNVGWISLSDHFEDHLPPSSTFSASSKTFPSPPSFVISSSIVPNRQVLIPPPSTSVLIRGATVVRNRPPLLFYGLWMQ